MIVYKQQRTCRVVNFAIPIDHRVKLKKGKNRYQYLDLAWEVKYPRNMKMIVIQIVICTLSSYQLISKDTGSVGNKNKSGDRPTTPLLKLDRILRRIRETWGDLLPHKLQWKGISWYRCEIFSKEWVNNNNNNLRRTGKLLETKLSSRNLINGINIRYSGPFLKWTRNELKQID